MSILDKNLLLEMFRKMEEIRRMDLKNCAISKERESARNDALFLLEKRQLMWVLCWLSTQMI